MVLETRDPYEITTEQLRQVAERRLRELEAQESAIQDEKQRVARVLDAFQLSLEGYGIFRNAIVANGHVNPYADEQEVVRRIAGLTQPQMLITLGLMNNRRFEPNQIGRLLHRLGAIKGKRSNVASRMWHLIDDHPDLFRRVEGTKECEVLPGAEDKIPRQ